MDGTTPMPAGSEEITIAELVELLGGKIIGADLPKPESTAWLRAVTAVCDCHRPRQKKEDCGE